MKIKLNKVDLRHKNLAKIVPLFLIVNSIPKGSMLFSKEKNQTFPWNWKIAQILLKISLLI
jgi:hypothetical protein